MALDPTIIIDFVATINEPMNASGSNQQLTPQQSLPNSTSVKQLNNDDMQIENFDSQEITTRDKKIEVEWQQQH